MIGFLRGSVVSSDASDGSLILEADGVGYEIFAPRSLQARPADALSLWIHTAFRDQAIELYGFSSLNEKRLFLSLLKVNGIGPKMALSILSSCPAARFVQMVQTEDMKALTGLPKVGKKTAGQIILNFKGKLTLPEEKGEDHASAAAALEKMGFSSSEIQWALSRIKWEGRLSSDLKSALKLLGGKQAL